LTVACGKSERERPGETKAMGGEGESEGGADHDGPGPGDDAGRGGGGGGGGDVSDGGVNAGGVGVAGEGQAGNAGQGQPGEGGEGGSNQPNPEPPNVVFVTSKTYVPAELGGLAGADNACSVLAVAAGLAGKFVAWLSTSSVDARSRLAGANGWYNTRQRPFADRAAELFGADQVYFPIDYDEHGDKVYGLVATGTAPSGALAPANCNDWSTSDSNATLAAGDANSGSVLWTNVADDAPCSAQYHLYCFQVDRDVELYPTPSQGRTVFVSSKPFELGPDGRAAADALCAEDAAAASLDGNFVALLPTSSESALERVLEPTRPWVRPDGMVIAGSSDGLVLDELDLAATTQQADGTYLGGVPVWGCPSLELSSSLNCDDWTNPVDPATPVALLGMTGYSDGRWHAWQVGECSEPTRIVCAQQ
jgi:hypothetical protein